MAKKKKDKIEDNDDLNQENKDNLNEADDSFGLPDMDYEPIDRSEEEDVASDEADEIREEEIYTSEEETVYYDSEPADTEEPAYIPGSYQPPKDDSALPKIIGVIVIVVLAALGIWYFGFYREGQKAEQARIEQQRKASQLKRQKDAQAAARERQRIAEEQAAKEAAAREEAEQAKPKTGTIETISARTSRYYVVVASAIDGDLAMDYAKELSKKGVSTKIISPFGKSKFHRVTIDSHDSWAEAQNNANDLKGQYGDGLWVIKY